MARLDKPLRGLAVMDPRWHPDSLRARDGGPRDSVYTERTPRPGTQIPQQPHARLVPEITEHQKVDAEIRVVKGGHVGIGSRAAEVVCREAGADTWLSWAPPNWFLDGDFLLHDTSGAAPWDRYDAVTIPSSQRVIVAATKSAASVIALRRWDPATFTWSELGSLPATRGPVALAVEPGSERVYLLDQDSAGSARVYRSDDEGDTWVLHSTSTDVSGALQRKAMMAFDRTGSVVLFVQQTGGALLQFASADLCSTFEPIGSPLSNVGSPNLSMLPDGRFVLVYRDMANDELVLRIFTSAYDTFDFAPAATPIADTIEGEIVAWSDHDGMLWVLADLDTDADWAMYCSADGGTSFEAMDSVPWTTPDTSSRPTNMRAVAADGHTVLLSQWATTAQDGSLAAYILGGWSDVVGAVAGTSQPIAQRPSWEDAVAYLGAWELPPSGAGWSSSGGGAASLDSGWLQLDEDVAYQISGSSGGAGVINTMWKQQIVSSSFAAPDPDDEVAGAEFLIERTSGLGWTSCEARIYMGESGFIVKDRRDNSIKATVEIDLTEPLIFWVTTDGSTFPLPARMVVRTRRPWEARWTTHASWSMASSGTGSSAKTVTIGNGVDASLDDVTRIGWMLVSFDTITVTEGGALAVLAGRPLSAHPYPLPEVSAPGERGWLRGRGGPGAVGDEHLILVEPDHPIRAIFPTVRPSLRDTWESDDTSQTRIILDLGGNTRYGASWCLALFLAGVGQRQVEVDVFEDAALGLWRSLGTWDGAEGMEGLTYALLGDQLLPGDSGDDAERWIQAGELVGGHAVIDAGGTRVARRIVDNSAGGWGPGLTGLKARLRLEGLDGTEDASGSVDIVRPDGVLIVPLSGAAADHYRYLRLTIPAGQPTVDGRYRLGAAFLGAFTPLGRQWGKGWSMELQPNVRVDQDPYGTERLTQQGPARRILTVGWPDLLQRQYTRRSLDPDYLGTEAAPLAARDDVAAELTAAFERSRGGELPVLALLEVPSVSTPTMITDRTLYLYGTLRGSVSQTHGAGHEGAGGNESVRLDSIEIRELV